MGAPTYILVSGASSPLSFDFDLSSPLLTSPHLSSPFFHVRFLQLLLVLILYVYAILGLMFMGKNDPVQFGTLATSMLSLFQVFIIYGVYGL